MRGLCISVFSSIVLFFFSILFVGAWLNYALSKEFVVHTKGVVLVTGTSSGIGKHAALTLAEYGYKVFSCVRNEKSVKNMIEEAKKRKLEKEIIPIILDVTNSTQIDSGLKEVTTFLSKNELPLVAIVNNAGLSASIPIELEYVEHVQLLFDVNFFGSVVLTQKFLPLIRRDKGRLIFVSSLGAYIPSAGRSVYAATKRAIDAVADTLRLELEPLGVSVSSLCAGFVRSSIVENSLEVTSIPKDRPQDIYLSYFKKEIASVTREFKNAPTAEVTSKAIVDAIQNPFPHPRYFMGTVSKFSSYFLYMVTWFVSERVIDVLVSLPNK